MSASFKPGLILFRVALWATFLAFCGLLAVPAPSALAQEEAIGQVMTLTPGVTVTRAGRTQALALKAPVHASDTLSTDATGRVRILFNDDSALSLGSNTTFNLREYSESGPRPVFNVHLGQGVARLITGKITEANPRGFTASTPEAVVGIRGTIISLRSYEGTTWVFVENTLRQVHVNGINVPAGNKIVIQPDVIPQPRPEPITPQEREELIGDLAIEGRLAAPTVGQLAYQSRAWEEIVEDSGLLLAGLSMPTQSLEDKIGQIGSTAFVHGPNGLIHQGGDWPIAPGTPVGDFGFEVNLTSGQVSGAWMNLNYGMGSYQFMNGTGKADPHGFFIDGFRGSSSSSSFTATSSTRMQGGPADFSNPGSKVSGKYNMEVVFDGGSRPENISSGIFEGTVLPSRTR